MTTHELKRSSLQTHSVPSAQRLPCAHNAHPNIARPTHTHTRPHCCNADSSPTQTATLPTDAHNTSNHPPLSLQRYGAAFIHNSLPRSLAPSLPRSLAHSLPSSPDAPPRARPLAAGMGTDTPRPGPPTFGGRLPPPPRPPGTPAARLRSTRTRASSRERRASSASLCSEMLLCLLPCRPPDPILQAHSPLRERSEKAARLLAARRAWPFLAGH